MYKRVFPESRPSASASGSSDAPDHAQRRSDSDYQPTPEFTDEQKQELLRLKREISGYFEQTTHLSDAKRTSIFHRYCRAYHPDKHNMSPFYAEIFKFISNEGYAYRSEQGTYRMPPALIERRGRRRTNLSAEETSTGGR